MCDLCFSMSCCCIDVGFFSKPKVHQLRTLRDQILTSAGREAFSARLAMLNQISREDIDEKVFTNKMIQHTKLKKSVDQTGPVLVTPGYSDVVSPQDIYQSNTMRVFKSPSKSSIKSP